VPSTRDLLQRFRPAATPGAATATGVPADRHNERAAELAGVFAALEETVAEADGIRRAAVAEAQQRRDLARQKAAARVAQARLDAESMRGQAVAEARDSLGALALERTIAAEQRAREIEQEAGRTRSEDVAAIVASVRSLALQAGEPELAR
jgi:hypothetical protein